MLESAVSRDAVAGLLAGSAVRFAASVGEAGWPSGHFSTACPMKNRLRELRAAKEWSQGELAEKLGVSRQTINAIETERYTPSLPLAIALARRFGRPVEEVFHGDDDDA